MSREEMEKLSQTVDLRYFLGVMNSRYAQILLANIRGDDFNTYPEYIRNIPIPTATPEQQSPIITLVDEILAAKRVGTDTTAQEREIDRLVYQLYGLTDEEIKVVEGK